MRALRPGAVLAVRWLIGAVGGEALSGLVVDSHPTALRASIIAGVSSSQGTFDQLPSGSVGGTIATARLRFQVLKR